MIKRYLTKSRFKEGLECETKLFYSNNSEYHNSKKEDSFLEALAEGGFQVGELAKFLVSENPYEESISVKSLDYEIALLETKEKLKNDYVSIAEAAFNYRDLFIRVDLLKKEKELIRIYEVKAKSWSESDLHDPEDIFIKKYKTGKNKGKEYINKEWYFYLYDIAFQRYVVNKIFPEFNIESNLVLADKNISSNIDGLNQKFKLKKDTNNIKEVEVPKNLKKSDLGIIPLKVINVDKTCDFIENQLVNDKSFTDFVDYLSKVYKKNERVFSVIDQRCFSCEYRADKNSNLKSGFNECFEKNGKQPDDSLSFVEDLWKSTKKEVDKGNFFIEQINENDYLREDIKKNDGMTTNFRQYLQIIKTKNKDLSSYYDPKLTDTILSFEKPYHFIDFETSAMALPFHKNRKPYEPVAFQYSYHLMDNKKIEHKGEFLDTSPKFPNYNFVRSLKNEFGSEIKGTIFRYHNHENTILNQIYSQLKNESSTDIPDKNELLDFIKYICTPTKNHIGEWIKGPKSMIDMFQLVVSLYYSPYSKGSNSIKYILPSVINDSQYLKDKYKEKIYGTDLIPSKNFKNHSWLNNNSNDPYQSLPPIFQNIKKNSPSEISTFNNLDDGGAAMTAYGFLQFSNTNDDLRKKIEDALLRYCELDTMAMVIIFEHFLEKIDK